MKPSHLVYISCFLLGLFSCKKDAGIIEPTELQDFSGVYSLQGNIEIQSNPIEEIPFQWVVTADNQGRGYQIGSGAGYNSSAWRWTIGEIHNQYPAAGQFRFIVYGGAPLGNSSSDAYWTVNELDSIFQSGQQLSFGTGFGQVGIEFVPSDRPPGEYWSLGVNNTDYKVTIEEVNDFKIYLPEYKWVKQVVVSFNVRLKRVFIYNSPNIILKNCRASLLFSPNVE